VHAIGAGVTLYELQEYSDVTYRLYDYGRLQANGQPRELHIERALDVIRYTPAPLARVTPMALPAPGGSVGAERRVLVACRYFVLEEVRLAEQESVWREPALPSSCRILTALGGAVEISAEGYAPVRLALGETALLPASLGDVRIASLDGAARLVRAYVPEPDDASLARWLSAHDGVFSAD
jgi:mannose-6-phosphate isomerase